MKHKKIIREVSWIGAISFFVVTLFYVSPFPFRGFISMGLLGLPFLALRLLCKTFSIEEPIGWGWSAVSLFLFTFFYLMLVKVFLSYFSKFKWKYIAGILVITLCVLANVWAAYVNVLSALVEQRAYLKNRTISKPLISDLVGRYELEKQTLFKNDLIKKTGKISYIELSEDGTYKADYFPIVPNIYYWDSKKNVLKNMRDTNGFWKLEEREKWAISIGVEKERWEMMTLMNQKPPYQLFLIFGDPDSNRVMIYSKKDSRSISLRHK